ncbi:MAG: SAM-dependent chlorinase/fluorinase, partial [Flavobacteriales bacterium]
MRRNMSIITLTTDWGVDDPYVAAFRGAILRHDNGARIETVTHSLTKHDRLSAAFLTISTFHHFPKGTVHFLGLDSGGGRVAQ